MSLNSTETFSSVIIESTMEGGVSECKATEHMFNLSIKKKKIYIYIYIYQCPLKPLAYFHQILKGYILMCQCQW